MGLLSSLQSAVADRLRATETIGSTPAVEIVEEDRGDIDAMIAKAVGKIGVVVAVSTPSLKPSENRRDFCEASVLIEIQENVAVNRGPAGSKKTWLRLGEAIVANLIGWVPAGGWSAMEFESFEQLAPGTPVLAQLSFTTRTCVRAE